MQNVFPDAERPATVAHGAELGRTVTVRDVLLVIRRHRWLIAVVTVLGSIGTAILALGSVPQYTASAQILIEQQASPIATRPEPSLNAAAETALITTNIQIIRSREHIRQVMADLDLFRDPTLDAEAAAQAKVGIIEWLADEVVTRLPNTWLASIGVASPMPVMLDSEVSPEARETAVGEFQKRFLVTRDDESRIVTVNFTFPDRVVAADVVNRAADLYITRQLDEKRAQIQTTLDWMHGRLMELEREVRASDDLVEAYRARNDLIRDLNARSGEDVVAGLTNSLNDTRVAAAALEARLRNIARMRDDPDALVGTLSSPMLVSLREQELALMRQEAELVTSFGERHPRMQLLRADKDRIRQKLRQEVASLASEVQRQLDENRVRASQLEQQIADLNQRDESRSGAMVGLRELERKAQVDRTLYELFLQRYREMGEQTGILTADARVVSYAKPPSQPSSLSPKLFALAGFTLSLFGGTVLALVADGLDRRVRGARQMERLFDLKVLDSVPQVTRLKTERRQYRYLLKRPLSAYAESLRSIYTSLQLAGGGNPPAVVVICSALSGEGKTSFTVSLAATAAQWGRRTLVVDLDVRHPCVEQAVGAQPNVGLAEVMQDGAPLEEAIRSAEGGFDFLGVGRGQVNPAGFIGNERMHALFAELRRRYDFIVVDTAPVLAVADTRAAVKLGDKVLVVTRWRHTPVSALRRAVQVLEEVRADIAGISVLRVDPNNYFIYESEDGANYYPSLKKYYVN